MSKDNLPALSFADDPELYDLVRPNYPQDVFHTLCDNVQLQKHQLVLELGPGSGKLTEELLKADMQLVCVEPARAFVKFLRGKFNNERAFSVVEAKFEDFKNDLNQRYHLVISAQSFHWIGWEVGLPKIRDILVPGGHLALLWYSSKLLGQDICSALDSVYETYPKVTARLPGSFTEKWQDPPQKISNSGFFKNLTIFEFKSRRRYTSLEYKLLASTQSQYKQLSLHEREDLLNHAVGVIRDFGGFIDVEYMYFLYTAQLI